MVYNKKYIRSNKKTFSNTKVQITKATMRNNPTILIQNKFLANSLLLKKNNAYKYLKLQTNKHKKQKSIAFQIKQQITNNLVYKLRIKPLLKATLLRKKKTINYIWNKQLHPNIKKKTQFAALFTKKQIQMLKRRQKAFAFLYKRAFVIIDKKKTFLQQAKALYKKNILNKNKAKKRKSFPTFMLNTQYKQLKQKSNIQSNNKMLYNSLLKSKINNERKQYNFYLRGISLVNMM